MNKKALRIFLQVLLVLSPLPLGCVGGVWLPLCFLLFALFAFLAFLGPQAPYKFLYQRPLRFLAVVFFALIVFQLLPLPLFLLKWLSPGVHARPGKPLRFPARFSRLEPDPGRNAAGLGPLPGLRPVLHRPAASGLGQKRYFCPVRHGGRFRAWRRPFSPC